MSTEAPRAPPILTAPHQLLSEQRSQNTKNKKINTPEEDAGRKRARIIKGEGKKKNLERGSAGCLFRSRATRAVSVNNNGALCRAAKTQAERNVRTLGPCSSTESWARLQGQPANPCGSLNERKWGVAMGTVWEAERMVIGALSGRMMPIVTL